MEGSGRNKDGNYNVSFRAEGKIVQVDEGLQVQDLNSSLGRQRVGGRGKRRTFVKVKRDFVRSAFWYSALIGFNRV